ncbi:UNVERIFIED_CONTAM: hypothetical protein PYX00_006590 [Menopon gallinae]|uniref:Uncharacterized protein n=1 Tax=Menopon gallinae TaxID=328185 RepID=A0AAW2HXQ5_9NEOP
MIARNFVWCFSACLLVVVASASVTNRIDDNFSDVPRSYQESPKTNEVEEESSWWSFPSKQINMIQRMLNDCSSTDPFSVCLKAKAVTFLDRVLRKDSIQIMDGLSLVADTNVSRARSGRALTEEELVASLPRELGKKEETLDEMIVGKLTEFFQGHKIQLDFAEEGSDVAEPRKKAKKIFPFFMMAAYMASMWYAVTLKGIAAIAAKALLIGKIALVISAIIARGKEKKIMPYIFMAKLWAASHMAMALKALALVALKALITAKVAFTIILVIALKKLFSHHHDHHTYEVVSDHQDHHDRSFNADPSYGAQLAYRAHVNRS